MRMFLPVSLQVALAAVLSFGTAYGGQVVDPSSGTVLFTTGDDVASSGRALGFTGHLFGISHTTIDITSNGNANFSANTAFTNNALPTSVARISPLWDDLFLPPGSVIENTSPGVYYAATWSDITSFADGSLRYTFQFVLFGASTTIGGFNFQTDDIAFAYTRVDTPFTGGDATVGLDQGDGVHFAPLPGTTDGIITNASLLPTDNRFVLFRWNGEAYNASVQHINAATVPEPASWLVSLTGLALLAARSLRRRR